MKAYEWPEGPMKDWAVGSAVRPYTGEGPAVIVDPCHTPIFRAVPAPQPATVVDRLIRMVEELLERDELTPDADPAWYRSRLREIKEEVRRAEEVGERGSTPSGTTSEQASTEEAH